MKESLAIRQAALALRKAALEVGGGGAMQFFAGTEPAYAETAPRTAPLAIVALATPCGAVATVGQAVELVLEPVTGNAAQTGQASFVRYVDGAGVCTLQLPVGLAGSGAAVILSSLDFYTGGEVQVLAHRLIG